MSEPLYLIATIHPHPQQLEQARSAFDELIEATRSEIGCLLYDLVQGEGESVWIMMEKWASKSDWDQHMNTPHVRKIIEQGPNFLLKPSELRILKPV
jgi:quinol monooxygenase YgiN